MFDLFIIKQKIILRMRNFSMVLLCGLLLINLISSSVIVRNPGCKAYDDQGVCKSCSVRFYKDVNNICQPVNPNCNTYDQVTGDCLSCYPGWGVLQGTCLPGIVDTLAFDPNCNKFQGSTCIKCSFGYYFGTDKLCKKADSSCFTFNQNNGQCLSCYSGFALSSGKCNPQAAKPVDPNCNQFDSNNICVKCSSGFYFNLGSCKKIDDSCKTFDLQKLHCAECYSGYVLNTDFTCVKQAPKENTNPLCAEWNNNQCVKCSKGSTFNQQGACILLDSYCRSFDNISGMCLKCYSGYTLGSDGTCQVEAPKSVNDPNCYSFGGNGQCTKCSSGFYFNALKVCVKIDETCKSFSVSQNKCKECYPGYQLGLGGECLIANIGITDVNCAQWKGEVCMKCSYGAVFDKNGKCVIIDAQCKQYDQVLRQCRSCYSGYTLDNNFNCVKSVQQVKDSLCAEWYEDVCMKCAFGSYFNSQGVCQQNDVSCKQSDSVTGKCKSCYSGYELSPEHTCIKSAPLTNANSLCSQWDSTGSLCLSCSKGSFFNSKGLCQGFDPLCKSSNQVNGHCTSCYDGYEVDINGKCVPSTSQGVSDSLCAQFTNNVCTKCSSGSYFNQKNVCQPIDPYCSQFDSYDKKCKQCYPGHAIVSGKCEIDTTHSLNDPYCAEFSNGICLMCSTGYYFEKDGKCTAVDPLCATFNEMNGQCKSCFTGYALQSGLCVPSQNSSQDPNCASFNPDNSCKKCSKGFFFDVKSNLCKLSNPLCKTFDDLNGACLSCYSGYVVSGAQCVVDENTASSLCAELIDGICVRCASRTFLNSLGQCETVSQDCRTYSDINGNCLSCYIGFGISNGKCIKSDVSAGCSQFTPAGKCMKCSSGYFLTSTNQCTQIDPQCANFNINQNKCEGCYSGYTLLQEKCEISKVDEEYEIKNCIAYNSDKKCIQCFDRFYLSNNQCKDVNVFCKTYDLITGQCTGCYSTFKLNNGQCTK